MIKKALAEGQLAVDLYSNYLGPSSFKRVAITQQTSCSFGQSWPELVYIPVCYFFDTTVRHGLGMDWGDRGYWKIVTPYEVAHQWWGHTIGFSSYRDQWMSEGFAEMSASMYRRRCTCRGSRRIRRNFMHSGETSTICCWRKTHRDSAASMPVLSPWDIV